MAAEESLMYQNPIDYYASIFSIQGYLISMDHFPNYFDKAQDWEACKRVLQQEH